MLALEMDRAGFAECLRHVPSEKIKIIMLSLTYKL